MAELLDVTMLKRHLKVEVDEDDEYIETLAIAARRACEKHIDRKVVGDAPELTDEDDLRMMAQAAMMLVGSWYGNRSSVSSGLGSAPVELPLAVRWLLEPLRRQSV